MRKFTLVFVLAVLAPSLVLAWLALRTLRDQEFLLERQQSQICQALTERVAQQASEIVAQRQRDFVRQVDSLLANKAPATISGTFDALLRAQWPAADIGFVVSMNGHMYSPGLSSNPEARQFRIDNSKFLCNVEPAEIFWNNRNINGQGVQGGYSQAINAPPSPQPSVAQNNVAQIEANAYKTQQLKRKVNPQNLELDAPSQSVQQYAVPDSKVALAEAEFRQLIGDSTEGTMARFLQDKLNVMAWYRPAQDPTLVFGARLNFQQITDEVRQLLGAQDLAVPEGVCLAILDSNTRPIARTRPDFTAPWKQPFAASEIGETLPHWEAASYLIDPEQFSRAADGIKRSIMVLVGSLILAIAAGSFIIVKDLTRKMTLARQKTDFVSNVSHELKTPLTSIRMFSDLLAEGRVKDEAKQRSYLAIISAETARLTRLINNVLDFSRMERGEKKYDFKTCDLGAVVREAADNFQPQLESSGFQFQCDLPGQSLNVRGDRDALSQIVLNLLSNAEKYSTNGTREIAVRLRSVNQPIPHVEVTVEDRGTGVPKGCEEKIFEKFYRAHDSLGSGIQGSGLGLTLTRQIARSHGGDVTYEPREGGGSCFTLKLPMQTT